MCDGLLRHRWRAQNYGSHGGQKGVRLADAIATMATMQVLFTLKNPFVLTPYGVVSLKKHISEEAYMYEACSR